MSALPPSGPLSPREGWGEGKSGKTILSRSKYPSAAPHRIPLPEGEGTGGQFRPATRVDKGVRSYPFIASTPPMISASSVVIWLWRARLYFIVRALTILSALSVALFMAIMRATGSLGVASRNAWKRAVRTGGGGNSSGRDLGSGENSWTPC